MTPMPTDSSFPAQLLLGALNGLTNQALGLVDGAVEQLAQVDGLVIRLRMEKPELVTYALLHADGIEFLQHYEGRVDVRLRASLGAFLQYLLLPNEDHFSAIRLQGSTHHLKVIQELLDYCSFSAVARGWLDHYVRFNDLLTLLGREDHAWLSRLDGLPADFQQLAGELAQQRLLQEDILEELSQLRGQLRRQRRLDIGCIITGLLLLFAAIGSLNGSLPLYWIHQSLMLASAGGALLASRLLTTA